MLFFVSSFFVVVFFSPQIMVTCIEIDRFHWVSILMLACVDDSVLMFLFEFCFSPPPPPSPSVLLLMMMMMMMMKCCLMSSDVS